ncbi:SH3 domain-containing protein [Calothrix sp. PCC 6303]|uniref:SH3 domain-containing protein n=1 Tax=Calothrix sp. PCC 6303 TaxID=1170562 RepID=UPI0002A0578B|nr:SH3 domain-containing protein [Calothrix sp. PCC 6303]AFZ03255.1 SH3 type 3 domain-containing protein [Calothrix sp. PCC 6303]
MFVNIIKYILGIFLAIAILAGSGLATALYFVNRTAITPPKPIYANDKEELAKKAAKNPPKPAVSKKANTTKTPAAKPTATPTAETTVEALPANAYNARVTWSKGLSLRAEPRADAESVGGVGFDAKVIVIEESADQVWQKIRIEGSEKEGWVKAGNTKKDDGQPDDSQSDDNNQTDDQGDAEQR